MSPQADAPDPARVVTKRDFARELTKVRDAAGVTVREVAATLAMPASTVGGYFSGAHLPAPRPVNLIDRILDACGVTEPPVVDGWRRALRRARRATGETASPTSDGDRRPREDAAPAARTAEPDPDPGGRATLVSTRPPIHRLVRESTLRGRTGLLRMLTARLDDLACAGDPPPAGAEQVYVLHGLGGCGKSTAALALARLAIERKVQTWWISAVDAASLVAGMQALAVELGAGRDQIRLGSSPDLVWKLLDGYRRPWLLVIDNADDPGGVLALPDGAPTDGTGWVRPADSGRGMVVITTSDGRTAAWGDPVPPWLRLVPVPALGRTDGGRVLIDLAGAGAGEPADAAALSDRLGGLPLALGLAGRYIAEAISIPPALAGPDAVRTFAEYGRALDSGRHSELLTGPRAQVDRAWNLSLDLLASRGMPTARPLLRLLSCFGPAGVPCGLLLQPDVLSSSSLVGPVSGRMVWDLLRALDGLGVVRLVRTDNPDPDLADEAVPHPLVRDTSRHSPDVHDDIDAYLRLVGTLVANAAAGLDPKDPHTWPRWRSLVEHSMSPLDLAAEFRVRGPAVPPQAVTAALLGARFLRTSGQLARAEAGYGRVARQAEHTLGPDHPAVLEAWHDLSRVWYDLGRLNNAIRGFRGVVRARVRVLGALHPDTLTSQHYLARALRDAGQLDASWRLFRKTLDARRSSLGDDHPDTWTSRNNVADALRALGRFDPAGEELRDVLARRERALGPEHPATLVSRYNLACLARDRGDLTGAGDQLVALVTTARHVLGSDHPRTMMAEQALVDVRHDAGDLDRAERDAWALLHRRWAVLGERHPATLITRHRLGLILVDRGRLPEAEEQLAAVLQTRRLVLGPAHPDTSAARESLDALRLRR